MRFLLAENVSKDERFRIVFDSAQWTVSRAVQMEAGGEFKVEAHHKKDNFKKTPELFSSLGLLR